MITRSAHPATTLWTRRVARGMIERGGGVSSRGVSMTRASIAFASASPNARALGQRLAGSLAMPRPSTESSRALSRGSADMNESTGGGPVATFAAIDSASSPGNARRPPMASNIVAASENWSLRSENSARASASGAL